MHLGFGLYRHMLDREYLRFARQCGATHIVVHLVDYFKQNSKNNDQPTDGGRGNGWGFAGDPDQLWTLEELLDIKALIESEGLTWYAIENFDPAHWHDVLRDFPQVTNLVAWFRGKKSPWGLLSHLKVEDMPEVWRDEYRQRRQFSFLRCRRHPLAATRGTGDRPPHRRPARKRGTGGPRGRPFRRARPSPRRMVRQPPPPSADRNHAAAVNGNAI